MRLRRFDSCFWGKRKIRRGGRVRFNHTTWQIDDTPREYPGARNMPYDGRLDGLWCIVAQHNPEHFPNLGLCLHSCPPDAWPGAHCVDGVFVWETFRRV